MNTLVAFAEFALGFAPMIALVLVILAAAYVAYKCSPKLAAWIDENWDRPMGFETSKDRTHRAFYLDTTTDRKIDTYL